MTRKEEIWKWIPGYENLYKISDKGNILTFHQNKQGKPLKRVKMPFGYLYVSLRKDGKDKTTSVHRLVLTAFDSAQPSSIWACHKNGKRADNRLENLYWGTAEDNSDDARRHGTLAMGERSGMARLTDDTVMEARTLYATGAFTVKQLAEKFGVKEPTLHKAITGQSWAHIKLDKDYVVVQRENSHKLTPDQAVEIRNKYSTGAVKMSALAKEYGVATLTVQKIIRREVFKYVEGADCTNVQHRGKFSAKNTLSIAQKYEIAQLVKHKPAEKAYTEYKQEIANTYGVSLGTIYKVMEEYENFKAMQEYENKMLNTLSGTKV
jgi:hypothetical protein